MTRHLFHLPVILICGFLELSTTSFTTIEERRRFTAIRTLTVWGTTFIGRNGIVKKECGWTRGTGKQLNNGSGITR